MASRLPQVSIRLTAEELARLDRTCEAVGVTRSAYLRAVALKHLDGPVPVAVRMTGVDTSRYPATSQRPNARGLRRNIKVGPPDGKHCPKCGSLTYSSEPGKRACTMGGCGWKGPVA